MVFARALTEASTSGMSDAPDSADWPVSEPASPPAPAILLMGPTAAGKSDLAIALAERLPCDIISVDSALVYRGMDIGTAKPPPELLARVPHHLIDILDPLESYSTARFRADALALMAEIRRRDRIPLLVGGTMLYFRGLQQGLAVLPSADPALRARLEEEASTLGWASLHARLAAVDPEAAARIHPNDPQRIQRALEVYTLTGRPMTALIRARSGPVDLPFRFIKLVRAPRERSVLHARIERRFHTMLEQGLLGEVARLRARGDLTPDLPSMRAVGYRQVWDHLAGACSREEMCFKAIVASRQLAKRQFTWLRAETGCHWLDDAPDPLTAALRWIHQSLGSEF